MASQILSPELDFQPHVLRHGSKVLTQIYQQTGGTSVSIPVASTTDSIFELPSLAFSLSDSYIRGISTPTAAGGAGNYNWHAQNVHWISELHLYTRGGQYLCQLQNLDRYDGMTTPAQTPFDDFITCDVTERLYPSHGLGTPTTNIAGGRIQVPFAAAAPYTEMRYATIGTDATADPVEPFTIRLSRFKDTIFALKKTLAFGEPILLRVVWGPAQRTAWRGTSATVAITDAAVPAGAVTITNMSLFLAVETDPAIKADMNTLVQTGYQLPIPYVSCNKQVAAVAATNHTITVRVTPDMGFMLKRLVYAPYHATESLSTIQDHDNRSEAGAVQKITSYQTSLDSMQRQQFPIDCKTNYDDWNLHRKMCRGSAIQNRNIYQYNWFHCEDFSGMNVDDNKMIPGDHSLLVSGIPIVGPQGSDRMWTMAAVTNSLALNHYTFIITYKTLVVRPGSIQVVNAMPS